jgi:hypothetical protein
MRSTIFHIWFLFALCAEVTGQEIITGMVADSATFSPLPFVNVVLKDKNKGTISDEQGNFKIVGMESDTLVFSFVGYNSLEVPLAGWQPSVILLSEKPTMLKTIIIEDRALDPYGNIFDEENELWREENKKVPFYYSRSKKQKVKIGRLTSENLRVQTYVNVVIKNEENRLRLMERYHLTEKEYYDLLAAFNAKHYTVMYYLTAGELITLLNNFFAAQASRK